ncbi:MAG: hypothetical protein RIQ79_1586 [Verrucomicrobiota bacterium]
MRRRRLRNRDAWDKFSLMVETVSAAIAEIVGRGRLGFIATNGLHDTVIIEGVQEDEYRRRIREGWRVMQVRPICRSLTPKLIHTRQELSTTRVFSYVLVILEHPDSSNSRPS